MDTSLLLFLGVMGSLVLSEGALLSKREIFQKRHEICQSKECEERAQVILSFVDQTLDPCEDFYSYACGKRNRNYTNDSTMELIRMHIQNQYAVHKILTSLPKIVEPKNTTETVIFMSQACMKQRSDEEDVEGGRRVLQENGFDAWPLLRNETSKLKFRSLDELIISTDLPNQFFKLTVADHPLEKSMKILQVRPSMSNEHYESEVMETEQTKDEVKRIKQAERELAIAAGKFFLRNASNEQLVELVKEYQEIRWMVFEKSYMAGEDPHRIKSIKQIESEMPAFPLLKIINSYLRRINITLTYDDTIIIEKPQALNNTVQYLLTKSIDSIYNFMGMSNIMQILYASSSTLFRERERINKQYDVHFGEGNVFPDCQYLLVPSVVSTLYVLQRFDAESKVAARSVLNRIGSALNKKLQYNPWMDTETRPKAIKKLWKMKLIVGYTDTLLNESFVKSQYYYVKGVQKNDSYSRIYYLYKRNLFYCHLSQLKGENPFMYQHRSQYANAYYSDGENLINLPAGILRYIVFGRNLPMYLNLGSVGNFMGHEMTHAFDNEGRHFDGDGLVVNWWTNYTEEKYDDKANCFVEQYSRIADLMANMSDYGKAALQESIADNGGVRIAFHAFRTYEQDPEQPEVLLKGLEKFTPEQLFFISFAMPWCAGGEQKVLPGQKHSPPKFRVNVPLKNMEEFSAAFQCKKGSPMRLEYKDRCVLW